MLAVFCSAQQAGVAAPGQKVSGETAEALRKLPGSSDIPLQKYDATAIVEIPDMSPSQDKPAGDFAGMDNGAEGSSSGQGGTSDLAPVQDPQSAALQTPVENALSTPLAQEELQQAEEQAENQKKDPNKKKQHFGLKLDGNEEDEDDGEVVILKVEDSGDEDEESYVSVDDEEILNKVFEIFKEKFKDEFNFTDED